MKDEYIKPVPINKLVRCEACGEPFLKTDSNGRYIRCFGLCRRCKVYFDDFANFLEEYRPEKEDYNDTSITSS